MLLSNLERKLRSLGATDAELEEYGEWLAEKTARLVTTIGPHVQEWHRDEIEAFFKTIACLRFKDSLVTDLMAVEDRVDKELPNIFDDPRDTSKIDNVDIPKVKALILAEYLAVISVL